MAADRGEFYEGTGHNSAENGGEMLIEVALITGPRGKACRGVEARGTALFEEFRLGASTPSVGNVDRVDVS